jgi:hypothetical protein
MARDLFALGLASVTLSDLAGIVTPTQNAAGTM